ncbi:MAG: hypothetical protein WDZ37_07120, partial [Solirubrobacterales bacterium]
SPAFVIATLALFVALGGTGYALSLPKNSVGPRQLKKNAVRTAKIRKRAVTRSKISNKAVGVSQIGDDAVTGAKLNESSIGTVPNADKLGNRAASGYLDVQRIARFTLTNSQTQNMFTKGPFTLTAKCTINSGGNDIANILISTTQDNSAFDGSDTTPDLDTTTAEANRDFVNATIGTGTAQIDHESDGYALAPDGTSLHGELVAGVNILGLPAGTCVYEGYVT